MGKEEPIDVRQVDGNIITAVGIRRGKLALVPCRVTSREAAPYWYEIAAIDADGDKYRARDPAWGCATVAADGENIRWKWGHVTENSDEGRALLTAFALCHE